MSLFVHTDITSVKLYQNLIFAGIGSTVNVYRKDSLEFLEKKCCLKGQKIYGFVPLEGSSKILIFGGKQYTAVSLEFSKGSSDINIKLSRLFEPIVCKDWLHSAVWVDENMVALLTAHNSVQIWNVATQTLSHQYQSLDNSILYSGLLLPLRDNLLVFAGTVFSEIIVHIPGDEEVLHHLEGHRGVIFSISCYSEKGIIVSTSDDRSVRIWGITPMGDLKLGYNTCEYWKNARIACRHEVYGHAARVMRSCITDSFIMSVGEDSALCFWDYEGNLLRKHATHQNSGIWSVDADSADVLTGGGDGAVIIHPTAMALEYGQQESLVLNTSTSPIPKKVAFTAKKNLVVLDESEDVVYYMNVDKKTTETHKLNHGSTNKFLGMSSCKQLIAVANMSGKLDIFVESCKDDECIRNIISTSLNLGTVLSMQWVGNRHLVLCLGNGVITVLCSNKSEVDIYAEFLLPYCKERWLTAAALHPNNNTFIVGDRCGNVHVFVKGNKQPVKTFNKVHGRYGPTSITIKQDEFITTGRDGTIKYFSFDKNDSTIAKYMNSKDVDFQWVEKFIDRDQTVICGFRERIFVIYDAKDNLKLVEVPCGGGHRTWDVLRYIDKRDEKYDKFIRLVYVKNNDILSHTFQMNKIVSRNVVNSTHSKEINCLKSFQSDLDKSNRYYVTGGEDTTLRISSLNSDQVFRDEVVFKHLSNVRTLKTFEEGDKIIIVSAGGRAQICIRLIQVRNEDKQIQCSSQEFVNYLIKGTDKQRKNNQTWRNCTIDFDPETRIMDLDLLKVKDGKFLIFAGCSDACLRVFLFNLEPSTFEAIADLHHHKTCILKTTCVNLPDKDILITCTTRGEVSLWDITNIELWDNHKPFLTTRTNKCGINSVDTHITSDNKLLVVTGGDDNGIHLNVLEIPSVDLSSTYVKHTWSTDQFHCSQITGAKLVDDALLSTSIDQRVTLAKWNITEDGIQCHFESQSHSDIADIQGMEVLSNSGNTITVCVFGKGLEVLQIPKKTR